MNLINNRFKLTLIVFHRFNESLAIRHCLLISLVKTTDLSHVSNYDISSCIAGCDDDIVCEGMSFVGLFNVRVNLLRIHKFYQQSR